MPKRDLDPNNLGHEEDWEGNNAAFRCPHCDKVFIVSGSGVHHGERKCPSCGKSVARCDIKGRKSGGRASLEW
jgi:phage FluMu protein Com